LAGSWLPWAMRGAPEMVPAMWTAPVRSYAEFEALRRFLGDRPEQWRAHERSLIPVGVQAFTVPGFCGVCRKPASFAVDFLSAPEASDGERTPNWRERMVCGSCNLNTRMRGSMQLFRERLEGWARARVYVTEQTSSLFQSLKKSCRRLVGSEFLNDGTQRGHTNARKIRHEDVTDLSFSTGSLDAILTFDVLEHVPKYRRALAEFARTLRRDGLLLMTVPFDLQARKTVARAELRPDGSIVHHLPAEYHGDPVGGGEGILAYHVFGWDLLDAIRASGFRHAEMHFYWSAELGYVGGLQSVIVANT